MGVEGVLGGRRWAHASHPRSRSGVRDPEAPAEAGVVDPHLLPPLEVVLVLCAFRLEDTIDMVKDLVGIERFEEGPRLRLVEPAVEMVLTREQHLDASSHPFAHHSQSLLAGKALPPPEA